MQALGDAGQTVASPTVAKRDGDRDDLRPAPPWHAIEVAHELREEIIGIQFFDEQLQKRPRAVQPRRAGREQPHRAGAKVLSPSLRIELVFCPCGVFEVTIEVVEILTAFAHGSPPGTRHATVRVPGYWRRARAARVLHV